jgi:5-methylcytosine-specific restriction endonuclease McrA
VLGTLNDPLRISVPGSVNGVLRTYERTDGLRSLTNSQSNITKVTRASGGHTMAKRAAHRKGSESRRARILKRDGVDGGWICVWCERFITSFRDIHVDHVVPAVKAVNELGWSEVEANADWNMAISCKQCNESKGDRLGPPKSRTEREKKFEKKFRPGFLGSDVPLAPPGRRSLSPVSPEQGSLWDLSEGADRGNA